jgi:hypothetical protein
MDAAFMKYYSIAEEIKRRIFFQLRIFLFGILAVFISAAVLFKGYFLHLMEVKPEYSSLFIT